MTVSTALPHWDMTVVFPGLESPEFDAEFDAVVGEIGDLEKLLDANHVSPGDSRPIDEATVHAFDAVVAALEQLETRLHTLDAYIRTFVTTDSYNQLAQARTSELRQHAVRLTKLSTRFTAWIGSLDVDELVARSSTAQRVEFAIRKANTLARHLLPLPEEDLFADLDLTGGSAWSHLYADVTSRLLVPFQVDGHAEELPMSRIRNLAYDADRDVRERAYHAELAAWEGAATPLAAALNSIKGQSNTMQLRRGWPEVLDFALFMNNVDRGTLDAMMESARASFPDFRRYMHAKAKVLGLPKLAWYDLFAPAGRMSRTWSFDDAHHFLVEQFSTFSSRLAGLADRAFTERWIDAEPRPGKVGGAFCMWLRGDQSRVLSNYMESYDGVSTLAHELGHAYHNFNLAGRSIMQRQTPMTLAETASIFCETIIEHAALERADELEQLAILEASIQGSCQVVVDISSRFMFERSVFEARQKRDLSIEEFGRLMLDSQRQT
ncbi:MAG: M3 family metallopeptidase, partial [Chloroflexota bacterium]